MLGRNTPYFSTSSGTRVKKLHNIDPRWNNGAGTKSIVHNVSLEAAMGGDLVSQVRTLGEN